MTTCKRCGAPIRWGHHGSRKLRALNPEPLAEVRTARVDVFVAHSHRKGGVAFGTIYPAKLAEEVEWNREHGLSDNHAIPDDATVYSVHNCRY
jgi:hypothetical protein